MCGGGYEVLARGCYSGADGMLAAHFIKLLDPS